MSVFYTLWANPPYHITCHHKVKCMYGTLQAGGTQEMISQYKRSLADLESTEPRDEKLIALRHEHVARIL